MEKWVFIEPFSYQYMTCKNGVPIIGKSVGIVKHLLPPDHTHLTQILLFLTLVGKFII